MQATAQSEMASANAKNCVDWAISSQASFTGYINSSMMKVQRLARDRVGPSGSKCGVNVSNSRPIADRMREKVSIHPSGCHEWTGSVMPNGYGQVHYCGKTAYAHRVAYELANGPTNGLFVCHSCDNRKCVNPAHLFLGTRADNAKDMVSKLRQAHGPKSGRRKLEVSAVHAIRSTNESQKSVALAFGVSASLVSMIRNKRIWKHV